MKRKNYRLIACKSHGEVVSSNASSKTPHLGLKRQMSGFWVQNELIPLQKKPSTLSYQSRNKLMEQV